MQLSIYDMKILLILLNIFLLPEPVSFKTYLVEVTGNLEVMHDFIF